VEAALPPKAPLLFHVHTLASHLLKTAKVFQEADFLWPFSVLREQTDLFPLEVDHGHSEK
jgi:hypothetical protein